MNVNQRDARVFIAGRTEARLDAVAADVAAAGGAAERTGPGRAMSDRRSTMRNPGERPAADEHTGAAPRQVLENVKSWKEA
jgi:hypothetical protein